MAEMTQSLHDPDKIVKEVFDKEDIKVKSELSYTQEEATSKALTWAEIMNCRLLTNHVTELLELHKSLGRKSMAEFVESLKTKKTDALDKSTKSLSLLG